MRKQIIEVIEDFYNFLLQEYKGADFFEVIPSAIQRYKKERCGVFYDVFCEIHDYPLDFEKCAALSIKDKIEVLNA